MGRAYATPRLPNQPRAAARVLYTPLPLTESLAAPPSDPDRDPRFAVIAAVRPPDVSEAELGESLVELGRLAQTLGLAVRETITQSRGSFHPGTYLGSGKVAELKAAVATHKAGLVLLEHEVTPSQARNLEKETGATVMDRTAVILEIFHRHARSRAARAQVEIVRLQYMAPRLREQGKGHDRQRGGIGGKGAGESGLELDRRKIRDRIAELTGELAGLEEEQKTQRARRQALSRVALVGYTNAGKSTLMRTLTGSEVYVADKLFATLDTTVRTLVPETRPRILVSDTVGFINKLPHGLVASFKSTLDEALEASLLLHVVDASDPAFERQLAVTAEVLAEIGAAEVPRLLVFNKADRLAEAGAAHEARLRALAGAGAPPALVMSARRPEDVARLRQALIDFFDRQLVEEELRIPYDRQELRGEIFARCRVLEERYEEAVVVFRVRAEPAELGRLRAAAGGPGPESLQRRGA
jgi:GTP-binding protein HflX